MIDWFLSLPEVVRGGVLVLVFLTLGTIISFALKFLNPNNDFSKLLQRMKAWWVMVVLFLGAVLLNNHNMPLILFCTVSILAMKEFLGIFNIPKHHRSVYFWIFFIIIIQYYWIVVDWYGMFTIFIPIFAFLFLQIRLMLTKNPKDFLDSLSRIQWGLLAFGLGLSHLGYLVRLGPVGSSAVDGRCLLLFLVILTETNDVSQYIWGKTLGKRKIIPDISPNKTWGGFLGGMVTTPLIGLGLRFLTPFSIAQTVAIALAISLIGFFGDLVMSTLKRDKGIKDFSATIPGHGGILDRMDSICFTAPLFFHLVRYFYY